jgi:hypothetical protein
MNSDLIMKNETPIDEITMKQCEQFYNGTGNHKKFRTIRQNQGDVIALETCKNNVKESRIKQQGIGGMRKRRKSRRTKRKRKSLKKNKRTKRRSLNKSRRTRRR